MKKITKTEIKCLSWSIQIIKTEKISKKLNKNKKIDKKIKEHNWKRLEKPALSVVFFHYKNSLKM